MITHDLNTIELCNLLEDYLYENAKIRFNDNQTKAVLEHRKTMVYAYVWSQYNSNMAITLPEFEKLATEAAPSGATPLVIIGTPDGIYEFNLHILKLKFELYSDGDKPDVMVAELPASKGKRILDFYPDFDTEEDYLDSLMGDAEPSRWDETDTW